MKNCFFSIDYLFTPQKSITSLPNILIPLNSL
jgi:hypothetical protein